MHPKLQNFIKGVQKNQDFQFQKMPNRKQNT